MLRPLALLAVVAAVHAAGASAAPTAAPTLRGYLARMGVQMNAYRAALIRADRAFTLASDRAAIAAFKARSAEFKRVELRIKPVRAPRGLAGSHPKIVRALKLVASAFTGFATARERFLAKRNRSELIAANTKQHDVLHTAQILELAWARAVRARTVKAGLVVPQWLRDFF